MDNPVGNPMSGKIGPQSLVDNLDMGSLAEDLLIKTNESLMYNELNLNDSILKLNTQ